MGAGAICTRTKQPEKNVQMPPISYTRQRPSHPTLSNLPAHDPIVSRGPIQQEQPHHHHHYQQHPPPQTHLEWPIPPREHEEPFELTKITNEEQYSLQLSYEMELSPRPDSPVTAKAKIQLHQKETSSSQWNPKPITSKHDTANVLSTLKTESHSCINLSTAEEISTLIADMNSVHTKLDHIVRRRLAKISQETEKMLEKISKDTELEQQDLLVFAKQRQTRQDELYREWLEKYIAVLNEWKADELARLQAELKKYQTKIIETSQRQITAVNKEANSIKSQLLKDEQVKASFSMDILIAQIESLSTHDTLQFLGTETTTNINLTVQANVGKKAEGQGCQFGSDNSAILGTSSTSKTTKP